jgi:hypothetical protein
MTVSLFLYLSIYLSIYLPTRLPTHVPDEAAIPTTPRNAPQPMAKRHRDLHELLATQKHPRDDGRRKNYTERPDLDTAVYTTYI